MTKVYENEVYKVTVTDSKIKCIKKKFFDTYAGRLDENGRVCSTTSLGLAQILKAKEQLGF